MGINGISDYSSIISNYRVPEIPIVSPEEVRRQDNAAVTPQPMQPALPETPESVTPLPDLSIEEKAPVGADVHDLSLTFNAGDDFGYLGKDSDIESLDIQKAISDMRKDMVLQQYQYFVGSSDGLFEKESSEDGMVFLKF